MASNKAPGIDRIQIRVIKDFLGSILPVLTSVINTSIASNMFPTQWKLAEVTPIPKDTDASNNVHFMYTYTQLLATENSQEKIKCSV